MERTAPRFHTINPPIVQQSPFNWRRTHLPSASFKQWLSLFLLLCNSVWLCPVKRRTDHSLGLHTQRFVELLYRSADGCMNLNDASVALRIKKRRLYDITNVLEGACIIRKISKNIVQLVQPRLPCNNCLSRYRSPGATHPSFPKYRMVKVRRRLVHEYSFTHVWSVCALIHAEESRET